MEWQQYHKNFTFENHLGRNSLDNHKLVTKTVANNNSGYRVCVPIGKISVRPRNDSAFVIVFRSRAIAEQLLPVPTSDGP